MMPVEINQWCATIRCFCVLLEKSPQRRTIRSLLVFLPVVKLYWFCCCLITISIPVLPLTLTIQFLAVNSVKTQSCFLHLFARIHHIVKTVFYTAVELLKRIPFGIVYLFRHKHYTIQKCLFAYAYFYIGCMTCYTLHTQWTVSRTILLGGDVETNPGPETLDFCTWNLNSISAHDFLRVSL